MFQTFRLVIKLSLKHKWIVHLYKNIFSLYPYSTMSFRSSWFIVLFKSFTDLLPSFFNLLWKWAKLYWNLQLLLLKCLFIPSILVNICFTYFGAFIRNAYIYNCYHFLRNWLFYYKMSLFTSSNGFCFKVCLKSV